MIVPALVGGSLVSAALHGTFHRNSPLFGKVIGRLPSNRREVALTFDDGPNPDATPHILDTLRANGVRATFFMLGKHVERWPELVRRAAYEGHQIGNHGYYHRKLHFKSPRYVRQDLILGAEAIQAAAAGSPGFFRAPHGFRSPWVSQIADSLGQKTVGWSLGVWDSDRPGVTRIVEQTAAGVRPGSIVLLHDGDGYDPHGDRMQTAEALPAIISRLGDAHYNIVTLPT